MTGPPAIVDTPLVPELVRGALELERTDHGLMPHRLPRRVRSRGADEQTLMAEAQPSGVRVVFRTAATVVELETLRTRVGYRGVGMRPDGVYDLVVDGALVARGGTSGGRVRLLDMATGTVETQEGPPGTVRFDGLPAGPKRVEIWLPYTEITELVGLRTDAPVEAAAPDGRRVWLHHGSSISQGSNASGPSTTWPALVAAAAGVELINVGLSGAAMADPFTAAALRDTPADLISVKLGINIVNADVMRLRAFAPAVHGFLDTVRDGHPDTPLLVVSPVLCPIHEDTPGPGAADLSDGEVRFRATGDPSERAAGRLTLSVVRDELARVVAERADPRMSLLDGRELYGEADEALRPLPDRLHPDAETHRVMAQRFTERIFGAGGPFAS